MLLILSPAPVMAQTAVIDVANLGQSVLQVNQLIQMIGLTTKDLASLANFAQVMEVLGQLQVISADLTAIMTQVDGRATGWDQLTLTIPCTSQDLRAWNGQASEWGRQGASEARRMTQIVRQSLGLMTHLLALVGNVFGTTSGLQTVSTLTSVVIVEMQKLQTISLPFQQVLLGQQQMEQMNHLASICLQAKRLEGWGTMTRW